MKGPGVQGGARILAGLILLGGCLGCPDRLPKDDQRIVDTWPPTQPIITGPSTVTVGTSATYNLSATEPQGLALEFKTTTPDCAIQGNFLFFTPRQAGEVTIQVTAVNSRGSTSTPVEKRVTVNAAPGA